MDISKRFSDTAMPAGTKRNIAELFTVCCIVLVQKPKISEMEQQHRLQKTRQYRQGRAFSSQENFERTMEKSENFRQF